MDCVVVRVISYLKDNFVVVLLDRNKSDAKKYYPSGNIEKAQWVLINSDGTTIKQAAVYGNPVLLPVSEESALQPQSPYGYHKLLSENICKKYFHLYNIPILILRPFSVYGNRLKKQIVWDVCHKMKNNDTIEMFGTGNESRDFIHIDDLLNCIDLLIKNANFCADIINIGNGDEVKIKDLVTLIRNHYPNKEVVFTNTTRIGDPLNWKADIAKLKKIGYKRSVSLVDGISQYINWFNDEILIDA